VHAARPGRVATVIGVGGDEREEHAAAVVLGEPEVVLLTVAVAEREAVRVPVRLAVEVKR
jgi:hypothetical protein